MKSTLGAPPSLGSSTGEDEGVRKAMLEGQRVELDLRERADGDSIRVSQWTRGFG